MDELGRAIDELARRAVEYRHWRIEQACEAALQGGRHGVLVRETSEKLIDVRVDPTVPYGEIYYIREDR